MVQRIKMHSMVAFFVITKPIRVSKRNKQYFVQSFSLARINHAFYACRKEHNNE